MTDNPNKLPEEFIPEIEDLPGDLAQLAKVLEEEVPGKGVKIVLRLEAEYRGTGIYFHNVDGFKRKIRDAWVVEQYSNGRKVDDIARTVRLSSRQVWNILGKEPVDEKQLRLF